MSASSSTVPPQYQRTNANFVEEPVSNLATEFAESRFMMSYKNTSPVNWRDVHNLASMSSLNAEAPAWCQYQFCDWSAGSAPSGPPPAPPLSQLLKRAQQSAQLSSQLPAGMSGNNAWHQQQLAQQQMLKDEASLQNDQMSDSGPLSPLQHASEQLKQQLLQNGEVCNIEASGRDGSAQDSPTKGLRENGPISPPLGSARKSRLAARFTVAPVSPDVSTNQ